MQENTVVQPKVSFFGDEVVVSLPAWMRTRPVRFEWERGEQTASESSLAQKKQVDFSSLKGVLKDVPEFQGKTSTEVKHMMTDIWAKMVSS